MKACIITDFAMICNMGTEPAEILNALDSGQYGSMTETEVTGRRVPVGKVSAALPQIQQPQWATRTNALLLHALERLRHSWNSVAPDRLGIVIGSSNSGIEEYHKSWQKQGVTEEGLQLLEVGNVAGFVAHITGAAGPCYTLSTACSSSAKALASAVRLLQAGVCDAVIAGGGDALCNYALQGFDALQLVSCERCRPFTLQGGGVNHGEGAALFVLTLAEPVEGDILLAGYGETADAYHTTTPEPDGAQATRAMKAAIQMAGLQPSDIDYVNLHGTGTDANDGMELNAMRATFGIQQPPCGSTKAYTGHTLGAAGALETAICTALLQRGKQQLPAQPWLVGEALPADINFSATTRRPLQHCLSNSFAFGGNNIALVLTRHA